MPYDLERDVFNAMTQDSSWYDDEIGSVDELGWYAKASDITLANLHDGFRALGESVPSDSVLVDYVGHLLFAQDSNGFCYVTVFDTEQELGATWDEIVADYDSVESDDPFAETESEE